MMDGRPSFARAALLDMGRPDLACRIEDYMLEFEGKMLVAYELDLSDSSETCILLAQAAALAECSLGDPHQPSWICRSCWTLPTEWDCHRVTAREFVAAQRCDRW